MADSGPRFYLVTPPLDGRTSFAAPLSEALDAADVACVLLRRSAPDPGLGKSLLRDLGPLVQKRGAACLLDDDAPIAQRGGADGVHVTGIGEPLDAALDTLKPNGIVGIGGLATRDEAMIAGEADVDYLMFGRPDIDEPIDHVVERVAWWAEIFNVPCVGFARDLDAVARLAAAGADFIALGDIVWRDPRGPAAAMAAIVRRTAGKVEPAP